MIRSRYDDNLGTAQNVSTSPQRRKLGGRQGLNPFQNARGAQAASQAGIRAPMPAVRSQQSGYIFEKYIPPERLLDPADLNPNLHLVFEGNLSEAQQRRLLRRMEREQRVQQAGRAEEEEDRLQRLEKERLEQESAEALSELAQLEKKFSRVSKNLEHKTNLVQKVGQKQELVASKEDEAMKQREMQRLRSGKKWALYQAVHLSEDGEELLGGFAGSRTFYGEPSSGISNHLDSKGENRKSEGVGSKSTAPEDMSPLKPPPRFERTDDQRAKMKALFDKAENEETGKHTSQMQLVSSSPVTIPVKKKPIKRRFVVDL